MEKKYVLDEEDVRNMSNEDRVDYSNFMRTIHNSGIIYRAQLERFNNVLQGQYKAGVLFNPNSLERYPEILSANLNNVLDIITSVRNDAINGNRSFDNFNFEKIDEGLGVLKEFVETLLRSAHYQGNVMGKSDLEAIIPRIDTLRGQLSQDMTHFQDYSNQKNAAIANYRAKKIAYDDMSLFGRIAARFNGKKKELDEAQRGFAYYGSARVDSSMRRPGEIINPYQYDEYLEQQEKEQEESKGGKAKW